jgi:hypothetical protein
MCMILAMILALWLALCSLPSTKLQSSLALGKESIPDYEENFFSLGCPPSSSIYNHQPHEKFALHRCRGGARI